jgi:protein-disulfide isomerase
VWDVAVGPDDPVRGPADAPVTVVVFSDFECPFCKRSAESLERLAIDYPKEVRVVWKDLPLDIHPNARAAAELARAARAQGGDPAFWAAHDRLFENQSTLGEATFRRIARELRVPWVSGEAALRAARFGGVFRASSLLADRVTVEATPTLFVNGRKLVGAQPYSELRALVDAALLPSSAESR